MQHVDGVLTYQLSLIFLLLVDFTLSVQICQCLAVIGASLSLILYIVRLINNLPCFCKSKDKDKISYECRKYRIVCSLITSKFGHTIRSTMTQHLNKLHYDTLYELVLEHVHIQWQDN